MGSTSMTLWVILKRETECEVGGGGVDVGAVVSALRGGDEYDQSSLYERISKTIIFKKEKKEQHPGS